MNRFEDANPPSADGDSARDALEARIRELEGENAQLRAKMDQMRTEWELDRDALEWYRSEGLPQSAEEAINPKNAFTLREVLAEFEREFGK